MTRVSDEPGSGLMPVLSGISVPTFSPFVEDAGRG
jgi:hypothetical protein